MKTKTYLNYLAKTTAVLFLATATHAAKADQLIIEHFNQSVADNSPVGTTTGWSAWAMTNGVLGDFSTATPNGNYPSISRAVNAGFGGVTGNTVMGLFGTSTPALFWTNTTLSLHDCTITNLTFYTKNNASSSTEQIVIQIGSQWYASTQTFHDAGGNSVWALNTFVFTTNAATWQIFNTNNLTLGLTNASPLPGGDIVAVGLYGIIPSTSGAKIRMDEFAVNGNPPRPPQAAQPTALPGNNVTAPTTFTLDVAVTGTPPYSFHWRKGGNELNDGPSGSGSSISGSLTSHLAVSTTSASDSGSYSVAVTNNYGSTTSAVVVITVSAQTFPPSINSIVTVPANGTNEVGTTPMSITVDASGTAPLSYQWYQNNVILPNNTNATLNLASAFTNAGSYKVVITNSIGSITSSPPTLLTVIDTTPPVITFPTGSTTNIAIYTPFVPTYTVTDNSGVAPAVTISGTVNTNVSGTYILNFTAVDAANNTNTAALTVKVWLINERFNETAVDNSAVSAAPGWHASAIAIASGLVTDYTATGGNGNFPTLSENPTAPGAVDGSQGFLVMGLVTSVNPVLEWLDTTTLLQNQQITNLTFYTRNNDVGNTVWIAIRIYTNWYASTVTFTDTTAGVVPWAAHSFDFTNAAASWQTLDVTTLTLGSPLVDPLPNQSISAVGFFGTMVAQKNRIDELQASGVPASFLATPPVVGQPTATPLNPANGSAWSGTPLTFQVSASGTPPLAYQWRKDGANISGATSNIYVLPNPGVTDSGTYEVVVSNPGGAVTSAVPAIVVNPAQLVVNEHFNESILDPGIIGQAPGWHVLSHDVTNNVIVDYTTTPNPPLNLNFPNLSLSAGADGTAGYAVLGLTEVANPTLVWLEAPPALQQGQITNIYFYSRNNYYSSKMQIVVRIAGQWYASTTEFHDGTLNAPPWELHAFPFAGDAGLWQDFDTNTLTPGSTTVDPLPGTPVEAVGIYGDTLGVAAAKIRIDEFRVDALVTTPPATSILPVYQDGSGNIVIRTASATGWNYVVESTPSLAPPVAWIPVQTNAGTGGVLTNLIPVNTETNRFFRYHLQ